jgi:anti-sigma factor RsiW
VTHIDVKAYAVGEMGEADKRSAAAHVASCADCREELADLQATLGSLAMLRDEDVPRRIAFVSDKVFEPSWWQRLNPVFASAALIAAAIVAHGYMMPPAADAAYEARMQQRLERVAEQNDDLMLLYRQQAQQVQLLVKEQTKLVSY